jgi:type I restriction enzyme S subunit
VTLALGTTLGARALEQGVNGSTGQLKLVQEHVEDVLVMLPDSHIQVLVGDLLRLAFECTEGARISVAVARLLVEQLIDGRITEADLMAAQKALESGNRGGDREILKALRQSGAPDAKPLIADVEALYALLDESEDAR